MIVYHIHDPWMMNQPQGWLPCWSLVSLSSPIADEHAEDPLSNSVTTQYSSSQVMPSIWQLSAHSFSAMSSSFAARLQLDNLQSL